jgi:PST family polysaccharide transporter
LRRTAARSFGVAGASYVAAQVVTFATYVVLARLATPTIFGTFAAGSILIGFGWLFSESGMSAALLQRRDNVEAAAATALASTALGGVILALSALALSPLVGLFFHSHEIGVVSAALSGSLILNGVTGVPGTLLQKNLALRRWIVDPVAAIAFGAFSAAGLALGFGVWGLVAGFYASCITRACGYWIAARWKPNRRLVSFAMWRDLARFARHILASEVLRELMNVANTAFVGRSLGPASLGQFRFGWRMVTQAVTPVLTGNAYTLQAALVNLSDDPPRMRTAALSAFRLVSLVAFPLAALFIPFGETLAVLLFGEAWRKSGAIMVALVGMGIALPIESVSSEIFKATGRPHILPRMHVLWAATSIVLVAALVHVGAIAVGIAWSISTACTAVYAVMNVPRVLKLRSIDLALAIVPPLFCALSTAIALFAFNRYVLHSEPSEDLRTWGMLAIELAVGAVVYLTGMALIAPQTLRELRHTAGMMMFRRQDRGRLEREASK